MIIKNGQIFDAAGSFFPGILTIKDSIITGVIKEKGVSGDENNIENKISNIENDMIPTDPKNNDEQIVDASDMYVIPGLTDIHFHGCVGHDFCEGKVEAIEAMAEYQLSQGITTICPASMSFDEEKLTGVFNSARDYHSKKGASLVGINMEGPFISYEKRGAQNPEYIFKPDADMFKRLQKASGGLIKLLDIAPEVDGARECIEELVNQVHISIAHTRADYDIAMETFRMGADHVTHLYNGMSNFHHRNPGVIGAASDWDKAYVELIGDGVHSTGSTVRATLKMIGDDRLVLISDSMEACGMPDGEYELGGQAVTVKGNLALLRDGTIAGSATNLMDCVRVLVRQMNVPLETAIKCAAVNSAKSIDIYDKYGSLERGKVANVVILDKNLELIKVIKDGVIVYDKN